MSKQSTEKKLKELGYIKFLCPACAHRLKKSKTKGIFCPYVNCPINLAIKVNKKEALKQMIKMSYLK